VNTGCAGNNMEMTAGKLTMRIYNIGNIIMKIFV
jgi:hypothetical protein